MMKVAIIGTRGIPNNYGGFEQCAEYLALGLVKRGIDATVYSWHDHPYQAKTWKGVNIVHCFSPVSKIGEIGEFLYDFNCIRDTRKRSFDVILQLGYTSNSVFWWLFPAKTVITTNMDGFEWQRTRRSSPVRKFIHYAESVAAKHSHYLVADSIGIQKYLLSEYGRESVYIPYGAFMFEKPEQGMIAQYQVTPGDYDMLIARIFPENNIEMILDGVVRSGRQRTFLVIGGFETEYGQYLIKKFRHLPYIRFLGGVYDINVLNNLRYHSCLYFHGHTVGGTNPSLLEAMASNAMICAHNNVYNSAILGNDAYYFNNIEDVAALMLSIDKNNHYGMLSSNAEKIRNIYSWDIVTDQYLSHFEKITGAIKYEKTVLKQVG